MLELSSKSTLHQVPSGLSRIDNRSYMPAAGEPLKAVTGRLVSERPVSSTVSHLLAHFDGAVWGRVRQVHPPSSCNARHNPTSPPTRPCASTKTYGTNTTPGRTTLRWSMVERLINLDGLRAGV